MKKVLVILLIAGLVVGIFGTTGVPDVSCGEDSDLSNDFPGSVPGDNGGPAPCGGEGSGGGAGQPG
jgi:hypothetical protein